ncbi:MAG TPA: (Fe-S)-binding protein [Bacillota bacterium]|nr:(Fe-S)-binding protein [Bacillota bacterium]
MCNASCNCGHQHLDPEKILTVLPQLDCGKCGLTTCLDYARGLVEGTVAVEDCQVLMSPHYTQVMLRLEQLFGAK